VLAKALEGAWRPNPPPLDLTPADFGLASQLYLTSGTAPLGWWRVRQSALGRAPETGELRDAYRRFTLRAVLQQQALARVVTHVRARGIEAIVVKGWAIARRYPEPGLRVYSDHDLCVRRKDFAQTLVLIAELTDLGGLVDLHDGVAKLDRQHEDDLFAQSILVDCGGTPVRVLRPEDHLRVLCCHFLRHGGARPLWLCDVAVAVETRGKDFDWSRCLGPTRRVAGWVKSTLAAAHQLLGMSLDGTPLVGDPRPLPRWLIPTVLQAWGAGHEAIPPGADLLLQPRRIFADVWRHWPNGLQATVAVRGPINRAPRLPFQVAACVPGAWRIARDTLRRLRPVR
jgi:hypothetical protein